LQSHAPQDRGIFKHQVLGQTDPSNMGSHTQEISQARKYLQVLGYIQLNHEDACDSHCDQMKESVQVVAPLYRRRLQGVQGKREHNQLEDELCDKLAFGDCQLPDCPRRNLANWSTDSVWCASSLYEAYDSFTC
jgi:hypothetical protein